MSAKAGYYHKDGNRIFRILDDYQTGNEDLDTVIKQTSSAFHEPYTHRTVANSKALTLQIGSEQTWAITSVDSSQDIQVLNRQIPINVDDSEELTKKVNRHTIERYGKGEQQFPVDDTIQVCREIFRILREEGYINVKVPFHDRIDWIDTSNRRNTSIFMDMLIAHTAMNRYQREKDQDGCYLATEEDFHAAKALFVERDAEELVHRLTRREREFAELLIEHRGGLTREEVAQEMNLSPSRISHLANGEKGDGGLSQKLPGFSAQKITDTTQLPDGDKRSTGKMLYKLQGYNPLEGFDAVVKLRDSAHSADGVRAKVRPDSSAEINNSEREKREIDIESAESAERERAHFNLPGKVLMRKNLLSRENEKNPHSDQETIAAKPNMERTVSAQTRTAAHSESADGGALHIGPHPRRDLPTSVSKHDAATSRASCSICGNDIDSGRGQTHAGESYCTSCSAHLARDSRWLWTSAQKESQSQERGQETTNNVDENEHAATSADDEGALLEKLKELAAQSEAEGKSIVPTVLAQRFKCEPRLKWSADQLRKIGYEQTTDIDPVSHMNIWKKKVDHPEAIRLVKETTNVKVEPTSIQ